MENVLKKQIVTIIATGLLVSCATSNPKFFAKVQKTENLSYGYTIDNPVTIKNGDLGHSINSSYYYLSRLRTEKGNKLQFIRQALVENPNYKKPAFTL